MKLAIVDLDGVIADSSKRFEKAEEAKVANLEHGRETAIDRFQRTGQPWRVETISKKATDIYWQTAFTPELISLDTVIDGSIDALAELAFNGYDVMLLTSRPESLREATRRWLFEQGYPVESPLILKPTAYQYVKTLTWKAGTVQLLASLYDASEVLFVDDEEINRNVLMDAWMAQGGDRELIVASSLKEALAKVEEV